MSELGRHHAPTRWALAGLLAGSGCQPLPEIEHETEHLRLGTDFDAPVCAGTLAMLDRAVGRIAASLDPDGSDEPFVVYWLEDELPDYCDDDATGCFYPGTRIAFAQGDSIAHELVHATIDSPGHAYFVEEGMAELYGGTPVRHDPRDLRGELLTQLALSRRDYDHGRLSYDQAAHFAHWVRETEGDGAMLRLAAALSGEDGETEILDQLEGIFDMTPWGIEQTYVREAPRLFPGLYDARLPTQRLEEGSLWLSVSLDCDDDEVLGPLRGAEEGMARLLRLEVPRPRTTRLLMEGDPGTWVELVAPYAPGQRPYPPWWPAFDQEGRMTRLEPGHRVSVMLEAGTYLLVFGASRVGAADIDLQVLR